MIVYPIGISGDRIILTERVLQHFVSHQQTRWYHREASGQLFARFRKHDVIVECATGPRWTVT